jgi:hypothetical protein
MLVSDTRVSCILYLALLCRKSGIWPYSVFLRLQMISTYIRIMTNKNPQERSRLLDMLMEVLQFLVVPETCYHSYIERYFEHGHWATLPKQNCGNMCSFCLNETSSFTGIFNRLQVVDVLTTCVDGKLYVGTDIVKKAIKTARKRIFQSNPSGGDTSPIHALLLQMVARNILKIIFSRALRPVFR